MLLDVLLNCGLNGCGKHLLGTLYQQLVKGASALRQTKLESQALVLDCAGELGVCVILVLVEPMMSAWLTPSITFFYISRWIKKS
jgi:hypothetical protein